MSESQSELAINLSSTQRTMLAALRHVPEKFNLRMNREGWIHLLELGPSLSTIDRNEPLHDCDAIRAALSSLECQSSEFGSSRRGKFKSVNQSHLIFASNGEAGGKFLVG